MSALKLSPFQLLREDLVVYEKSNAIKYKLYAAISLPFMILVFVRLFAAWKCSRYNIKILRVLVERMFEFAFKVHVSSSVTIGRRFRIYHGLGIVINGGVVIGDDCIIYHRVTIGQRFPGDLSPHIGNRVIIGTGAVVLGPVKIPSNSLIPANAVVTPNHLKSVKLRHDI